jgi:protein O-GlcNAcase/histone acetyltransferase
MFDDIPNNFNDLYGFNFDEGRVHAELANKLAEDLNFKLILVPRVYAHELNIDSPEYLISFGKYINNEIPVFHCGEKIVTRNINKKTIVDLKFYLQNKIIFWDNLYANDYCPRRLFICPWIGRSIKNNIMINPTGMIETDLLILDIIAKTPKDNGLFKVLEYHGVPKEFYSILDYFKNPVFQDQKNTEINCSTTEQISAIDYLLWEWKTSLSIEWYTYLMGLKQDILISTNQLPKERIIKTQNTALCKKLLQ